MVFLVFAARLQAIARNYTRSPLDQITETVFPWTCVRFGLVPRRTRNAHVVPLSRGTKDKRVVRAGLVILPRNDALRVENECITTRRGSIPQRGISALFFSRSRKFSQFGRIERSSADVCAWLEVDVASSDLVNGRAEGQRGAECFDCLALELGRYWSDVARDSRHHVQIGDRERADGTQGA